MRVVIQQRSIPYRCLVLQCVRLLLLLLVQLMLLMMLLLLLLLKDRTV